MTPEIILVPIKGTPHDHKAVAMACDMVKPNGGRVVLLYILEISREHPLDIEDRRATALGEDILNAAEAIARKRKCSVDAQLIQAREVGPAIIQEAIERNAITIFISLPYKEKYGAYSMGTTAPYVLKNAPCQVVLRREPVSESQ
jgi:nucleotide-binding universal stress UspA family protein